MIIRNVSTFNLNRDFADGSRLNVKQSLAFFNRKLTTPLYRFEGDQFNSFTDISMNKVVGKHALVFGGSAVYDQFREDAFDAVIGPRDETRTTVGAFIQDTVDITERVSFEGGFRLDYSRNYGAFALPRVSLLYRSATLKSIALFGYNSRCYRRFRIALVPKHTSVGTSQSRTQCGPNVRTN